MMFDQKLLIHTLITVVASLVLSSCTQDIDCSGPQAAAQVNSAEVVKDTRFSTGPNASLFLPNPIESRKAQQLVQSGSSLSLEKIIESVQLPQLTQPSKLEHPFIKVRIQNQIESPLSISSQTLPVYHYTNAYYSQVLGYFSLLKIMKYVESLGFSILKDKPLLVLVRSPSNDPGEINAFYEHNYFKPNTPRTMKLIGGGNFSPGADRDMYWHEFGHLMNESITNESGIDLAGDRGAIFTEGAAIHECIADYLTESLADKGYIGKWIARNFNSIPNGLPLRSAIEHVTVQKLNYNDVQINDNRGIQPERYLSAETCTRALWKVREHIKSQSGENGAVLADRLVLGAVSQLGRDTSFRELQRNLVSSDSQLYCGFNKDAIQGAFKKFGFESSPASFSKPMNVQFQAVGVILRGDSLTPIAPSPGEEIGIMYQVENPNNTTAKNVRIRIESNEPGWIPITYMQGLGHIGPGDKVTVTLNSSLPLQDYGLFATTDISFGFKPYPYNIIVESDNGPTTTKSGIIQ